MAEATRELRSSKASRGLMHGRQKQSHDALARQSDWSRATATDMSAKRCEAARERECLKRRGSCEAAKRREGLCTAEENSHVTGHDPKNKYA